MLIAAQHFKFRKIGATVGAKFDGFDRKCKQLFHTFWAEPLPHFLHNQFYPNLIQQLLNSLQRRLFQAVPFRLKPFLQRINVDDQPIGAQFANQIDHRLNIF